MFPGDLLAGAAPEYRLPIFIWLLRIKGGDDSGKVVPWFPLTWYKMVKHECPRENLHMYSGRSALILPCHPVCMFDMKLPSSCELKPESSFAAMTENLGASQKSSWFTQECRGKMKRISHEMVVA